MQFKYNFHWRQVFQIQNLQEKKLMKLCINLNKAHDCIASKDLQIGELQRQICSIQTKFEHQLKIHSDLRSKDEHILKEFEEQTNIIDKIKIQLRDCQNHNHQLTINHDKIQKEFDIYKETKEVEIAELKIDNQNLIAEYEEYKTNYNEYQQSVISLKQCLDKIKSDYHLLSIENSTLQKMLEKEKNMQSKYRHRSIDNANNSNIMLESFSQFSKSQINQYESAPIDPSTAVKVKESRYYSVRNTEERKRKESNTSLLFKENDDAYQYNICNNHKSPVNDYHSPICSNLASSTNGRNRGSKFSLNSVPK